MSSKLYQVNLTMLKSGSNILKDKPNLWSKKLKAALFFYPMHKVLHFYTLTFQAKDPLTNADPLRPL